jgi:hypothetical protein
MRAEFDKGMKGMYGMNASVVFEIGGQLLCEGESDETYPSTST